jgi:hypothetical protein
LRFGRKGFRCPGGVGGGVIPRDLDDGMIQDGIEVRARAERMVPGCSWNIAAPGRGGNGVFYEPIVEIGRDVRQKPGRLPKIVR